MALPKLQTPTYELNLPSSNAVVKFRPFLVKEEKILMMAQEAGDTNSMMNGVKQIIEKTKDSSLLLHYDIETNLLLTSSKKSVAEPFLKNDSFFRWKHKVR